MSRQTSIPLNQLVRSPRNVRKQKSSTAEIRSLADSIRAQGLIQNLVVAPTGDGAFAVEAGDRRLQALTLLAEDGTLPADHPIPCLELEVEDDATEISLAENVKRVSMHAADEFEAFSAMIGEGKSVADVASRFGVSEAFIRQRMKLAAVSPNLIEAFRQDKMTLDLLMAFTVSNDHAAQERAFAETSGWERTPNHIRTRLTRGAVRSDEALARFVGVDAYEAAGGAVTRDLFAAGAYLEGRALLERLAGEALESKAAELKAEGWSWAEVRPSIDWQYRRSFQRIEGEPVPLNDEEEAELETLRNALDGFEDRGWGELSEQEMAEAERLETRIDELSEARFAFTDAQKASSGVLVSIGHGGTFELEFGLVWSDGTGAEAAGHAAEAQPERAVSVSAEKPLSAALIEELSAQRTAALAVELSRNPRVALVAAVHKLVIDAFFISGGASCLQLTCSDAGAKASMADADACQAMRGLEESRKAWGDRIPGNADDLWLWLLDQDMDTLLELLALGVAGGINAIDKKHDWGDNRRRGNHAGALAAALDLDMTRWWRPTAAAYFSRVPKLHIERVVREVCGEEAAGAIAKMKKKDAAERAEQLLGEAGWLPEQLRGSPISGELRSRPSYPIAAQ